MKTRFQHQVPKFPPGLKEIGGPAPPFPDLSLGFESSDVYRGARSDFTRL
jgi:hypothetical protein